jgi:hypothetical protein
MPYGHFGYEPAFLPLNGEALVWMAQFLENATRTESAPTPSLQKFPSLCNL